MGQGPSPIVVLHKAHNRKGHQQNKSNNRNPSIRHPAPSNGDKGYPPNPDKSRTTVDQLE